MAESVLGESVLVVERDENVRRLQRFFLERGGFVVHFCDDGPTALASARALQPAVLVAEILLPGMDGLTLCRRVRDDPATSHIPVVIFSVLAAAARAADAGATRYLRKPLVEATFLAAIRAALDEPSFGLLEQQ